MYLFPSSLSGCWQHWVLCWLLARAHCQFLAAWVSPTWQLALSKHAKWKDNTESRPARYGIIFSNLIMEVTPIIFRLRRKSHSREEISQGHEHKEMEIIGGHVRSYLSQIPEADPGIGLILNWSVRKCFQQNHKEVCDTKQSPAEENFGSICKGDWRQSILELSPLGARELEYLYPAPATRWLRAAFRGT